MVRRVKLRMLAWRGTFSAVLLLLDVFAIIASSIATGVVYHILAYGNRGDLLSYAQVGGLIAAVFTAPLLYGGDYLIANCYSFKAPLKRAIHLWNISFVVLLAVSFLAKTSDTFSRAWIVLFYVTTLPLLLGLRVAAVQLVLKAFRAGVLSSHSMYLIGGGREIGEFLHRYKPWSLGLSIVGCRFLTPTLEGEIPSTREQMLGEDLASAVDEARILRPELIFLILPWSDSKTLDRCIDVLSQVPAEIHLGPERILEKFEDVRISRLGPLASLQISRLPLTWFEVVLKRAFDVCAASVGLLLLLPLFLAVAILIKRDSPGPVFFLQRRYGFNQRTFRIVKFRTMRAADDGDIVRQARHGDPRVTKLGRWLRRWNIDELPQLINVLLGDMSLVGPRPHAVSHNLEYQERIAAYARRHNMKPGITGWAQINGFRGETDTDEKMRKRVEYDLFYIDNWSLSFDLRILIGTVFSRKAYRNAY